MSAHRDEKWGAGEDFESQATLRADHGPGHEIPDAEQVRRDQFNEAVRQALARQARAAKKRDCEDFDCRALLTRSELHFLLKHGE